MVLLLAIVVTGCGQKENPPSGKNDPVNAAPAEQPKSQTPSNPTTGTQQKDGEGKTKLDANEEIALEYINVFLNGNDKDAKEKYLQDKVHPESKPIFQLIASLGMSQPNVYREPKVIESVDHTDNGKKLRLVLIRGEDDKGKKEAIVSIYEGKLSFVFLPNAIKEEKDKKTYEDIRGKFKSSSL
jgi:predicted small lipoprotein YifL